jgi:lipoprotein-anchoring transpeptidase ErfK/SrfK
MKKIYYIVTILVIFLPTIALAQSSNLDSDGDGLGDEVEQAFYYTDPFNADTDNDGFNDKVEIENGYSPHFPDKKLIDSDLDNDGLNDNYEIALKTYLKKSDSDGDGFSDGQEFNNEYDPRTSQPVKLEKKIAVYLSVQRLKAYLGPVKVKEYMVSTGKASTPTPVGSFSVTKKNLKAWSQAAGLWMPYWMQFKGAVAFHELPEWPNGQKEGADHLGIPVSHGCVRLGIGPAKELYDWTPVGTKVVINK